MSLPCVPVWKNRPDEEGRIDHLVDQRRTGFIKKISPAQRKEYNRSSYTFITG
ncbi:MAG: hypothetical protein WC525_08185 [Candidatus Thermoplasmatota archaeon]